jgi:hypothetical protein
VDFSSELYGEGASDGSNAFFMVLDIGVSGRSEEGHAGVGLAGDWWGGFTCPFGADDPEPGRRVVAFLAVGGGTCRPRVERGAWEAHSCEETRRRGTFKKFSAIVSANRRGCEGCSYS